MKEKDVLWHIIGCGNGRTGWIVNCRHEKITTLISLKTASKVVSAHNQMIEYIFNKATPPKKEKADA